MTKSINDPFSVSRAHVFGLRHLLIAVAAIAIPMALFSRYWARVNDTVDERTVPFSDVGLGDQVLLYSAAASLALIAVGLIAWLLSRRTYLGTAGVLLVFISCLPFIVSFAQSRIINPEQGNPEAALHNDAAAIAATAISRYYARTRKWPRDWDVLDDDIAAVIDDVGAKHQPTDDPFAAGDPFAGLGEDSQSLFSRAPDLDGLTAYELRNLVDVNFDADPQALATMSWIDFDGIVPHKPSYNMYRVEFRQLIDCLNEPANSTPGSLDVAK